jgi:hypothetical protein
MTPKEKAKELVHEMMNIDSDSEMFDGFIMKEFYAQRAALKAVDEIIEVLCKNRMGDLYYRQVKQEIELL